MFTRTHPWKGDLCQPLTERISRVARNEAQEIKKFSLEEVSTWCWPPLCQRQGHRVSPRLSAVKLREVWWSGVEDLRKAGMNAIVLEVSEELGQTPVQSSHTQRDSQLA